MTREEYSYYSAHTQGVGNIVDKEPTEIKNGIAIRVAVNWRGKNGAEGVSFRDLLIFGSLADDVLTAFDRGLLAKGARVAFTGRIADSVEEYEDRNGNKRTANRWRTIVDTLALDLMFFESNFNDENLYAPSPRKHKRYVDEVAEEEKSRRSSSSRRKRDLDDDEGGRRSRRSSRRSRRSEEGEPEENNRRRSRRRSEEPAEESNDEPPTPPRRNRRRNAPELEGDNYTSSDIDPDDDGDFDSGGLI